MNSSFSWRIFLHLRKYSTFPSVLEKAFLHQEFPQILKSSSGWCSPSCVCSQHSSFCPTPIYWKKICERFPLSYNLFTHVYIYFFLLVFITYFFPRKPLFPTPTSHHTFLIHPGQPKVLAPERPLETVLLTAEKTHKILFAERAQRR